MEACTRPGMQMIFCLSAENGLGRFVPWALPHFNSISNV